MMQQPPIRLPHVDGARAIVVNRTHRVVREQALSLRAQRERQRSLWLPLGIVSVLMFGICYAVWALLDGYDLTPNGVPDASDQLMIWMLWSLPLTIFIGGIIWLTRRRSSNEARR